MSGQPEGPASGEDSVEHSLIGHLVELRSRVMRALLGVALVLVALLPFMKPLFNGLAMPLLSHLPSGQATQMIANDPTSGFFAPIKLALFGALFIAAPWVLYQAWAFVAPGLYKHERRLALPLLGSAIVLFYAGWAFAYFVVLQGVFRALMHFTPDVITIAPDPTKYVDFVFVIFLAFGASFELPVALVILVLLGWVTPAQLKEWRGYAIVGIFVLAAVITPPDVVSQLMLAVPMILLYEAGILASRLLARKPGTSTADDRAR